MHELLSAFIDALGIGIVRFGLFNASRCFLEIGLRLFDRSVCSAELRFLLAVSSRAKIAPFATRSPTSARRSTNTPDILKPTCEVTRASTVPRPKTWTGIS